MAVTDVERVRAAAARVADITREQADEVERERRLTAAIVAALRDNGLNRMFLPTELGGMPLPPRETLDIVAQISEADASVGWCTLIGAGTSVFAGLRSRSIRA
jgi:alkylation response protein AidB-like acyl-CoA dehydrogenase